MLPFNITVNPTGSGVVREHAEHELAVGVVCEGKDELHEAGAYIAARILAQSFIEQGLYLVFPNAKFFEEAWDRVEQDVTSQLYMLAKGMGALTTQVIEDEFMFNLAGFVATPKFVSVFSIGGWVHVNGEKIYPADFSPGLLMQQYTTKQEWNRKFCHFKKRLFRTNDVSSIVVGEAPHRQVKFSQVKEVVTV